MRHVTCEGCQQSLPLNATFLVFEQTLCAECGQQRLEQHEGDLPPDAVAPQVDPTVCARCQADNGAEELPRLLEVPLCAQCMDFIRHRPYPGWIKAAFVLLVGLAVVSLMHNRRFFLGHFQSMRATRAFERGDTVAAARLMTVAANHVPESEALRVVASFFQGVELLSTENYAEAAERFRAARGLGPAIEVYLLYAEGGAAFDRQDYETFLQKQLALARHRPDDPIVVASVASAYACKFAVTGDEQFRELSLQHLEKARALPQADSSEFGEYERRIRHRLATKEILTREQYQQRFPQGWTPEQEAAP